MKLLSIFKKLKKDSQQMIYKNYDALLFLPPVSLKIDKKTQVIEKNGVHATIMYSETIGVYTKMDLPIDFQKMFYKMTAQVNKGIPSNRIVYFATVYVSPQEYAKMREKVLKMNVNAKKKFFVFPRWIWLALERHPGVNEYFVMNKFDDDNPVNFSKEFDNFGAVGITYSTNNNVYFLFASVVRKELVESMNRIISLGLWGS